MENNNHSFVIKIVPTLAHGEFESDDYYHKQPTDENWIVSTKGYPERFGGLKVWYDMIKKSQIEEVYLYEIRADIQGLPDTNNDGEWVDEIVYYVRADYRRNQEFYEKSKKEWLENPEEQKIIERIKQRSIKK
ncbi:MAG: hypothetical protein H8E98_05560 [Bacteroidetes bacterium]|nr:hypothetical protein [Bacteroidota bacterium]